MRGHELIRLDSSLFNFCFIAAVSIGMYCLFMASDPACACVVGI